VLFCAIQGVGFMYFWPTLLALVSRAAPPKINATMMGVCFLTLFVANNLIGRIGAYYEKMTPVSFWALHACIGAAGGVVMLLSGRSLGRILEPQPNPAPNVGSPQ
jgi:POT family proton-dependent oligopeptide transporter